MLRQNHAEFGCKLGELGQKINDFTVNVSVRFDVIQNLLYSPIAKALTLGIHRVKQRLADARAFAQFKQPARVAESQ